MFASLTLSSSAKLAFIGLSYVYIAKFIDTLWHGIFANPVISFAVVGLNILAGIAQFLFFFKLKTAKSENGIWWNIAGWSGALGALINIIPKILALSVLLQFYFTIDLIKNSQSIATLSPWLGAVMLFFSCILFFFLSAKIRNNQAWAFFIGATGYLILAVTFSMLLLNLRSGLELKWQDGEIATSLVYFIVSASLSFLCIAYFYARFIRYDENIESAEYNEF